MSQTSTSQGHYRALGLVTFSLGEGEELVYSEDADTAFVLPTSDVDVLSACETFRTIAEHAEETGSSSEQLKKWAESGLLVSRDTILEACRKTSSESAPVSISSVGIVAGMKPEHLERCVASVAENLRDHGKTAAIVVVDGSGDPKTQERHREILRAAAKAHGIEIRYAGDVEKRAYRKELEKSVPNAGLVDFALGLADGEDRGPGAGRNALLLDTVGEAFVSLNDDTLVRMAGLPNAANAPLSLTSVGDPSTYAFHADPGAAEAAVSFERQDFLGCHERYLGRTLAACLGGSGNGSGPDLDGMDARFLQLVRRGRGQVRVTPMGVVGDSGLRSNSGLLTLDGPSRDAVMASEEAYRRACVSRSIVRCVDRPTLSGRPKPLTGAVGIDHRELLPPFAPCLPGEDGVFGVTLAACFREACSAHVPWMVHRLPREGQPAAAEEVWKRAAEIEWNAILGSCLSSLELGDAKPEGTDRMRVLGEHLRELGGMNLQDFEEIVRKIQWLQASSAIEEMESLLEAFGSAPAYWAEDVKKAMDRTRESLTEEAFVLPCDLRGGRDVDRARERSRQLVGRFGELLCGWTAIEDAARVARKNSIRVSAAL